MYAFTGGVKHALRKGSEGALSVRGRVRVAEKVGTGLYCGRCGTKIKSEAAFCVSCGESMPQEPEGRGQGRHISPHRFARYQSGSSAVGRWLKYGGLTVAGLLVFAAGVAIAHRGEISGALLGDQPTSASTADNQTTAPKVAAPATADQYTTPQIAVPVPADQYTAPQIAVPATASQYTTPRISPPTTASKPTAISPQTQNNNVAKSAGTNSGASPKSSAKPPTPSPTTSPDIHLSGSEPGVTGPVYLRKGVYTVTINHTGNGSYGMNLKSLGSVVVPLGSGIDNNPATHQIQIDVADNYMLRVEESPGGVQWTVDIKQAQQ